VFFENPTCGDKFGREIHDEKHEEILYEMSVIHAILKEYNLFLLKDFSHF